MRLFQRLVLFLVSFAVFGYVIYFTEPPKAWSEASTFQILSFFIPLLCSLTFLINIFLDFLPKSFILSLGIMMLLVLKTANSLNIITGIVTTALTIGFFIFFKKEKSLTIVREIPKLGRLRKRRKYG